MSKQRAVRVVNPGDGPKYFGRQLAIKMLKRGLLRIVSEFEVERVTEETCRAPRPFVADVIAGKPTIDIVPRGPWLECWRTTQAAVFPPAPGYYENMHNPKWARTGRRPSRWVQVSSNC